MNAALSAERSVLNRASITPLLATLLAATLSIGTTGCGGGGSSGGSSSTQSDASSCDGETPPGTLERASVDFAGNETFSCQRLGGGCKNNSHPSLSADGVWMAFDSDAELVAEGFPNPANVPQVYVRNLVDGTVRLASAMTSPSLGPTAIGDDYSAFPILSGDGTCVVFISAARNLDVDDQDGKVDVYLHDLAGPETWRVTELPDGTGLDGSSLEVDLSYDGKHVAFRSGATTLEPLIVPGCGQPGSNVLEPGQDIFVFDRELGHFEWLSVADGCRTPNGPSSQPSITYDGRLVAFRSKASNLVPFDGNGDVADIFVRDRLTGEIVLVSANVAGEHPNGPSSRPAFAGNGRYVAFESLADDLVPGDTNGVHDIFVRDLDLGTTVRITVSATGEEANGGSAYAALSADGRYVVYTSLATNLVPFDDTAGFTDIFIHDRDLDDDGAFDEPGETCTRRLSVNPLMEGANAVSGGDTDISDDGRFVPFMSEGSNLVPNDTNGIDQSGSTTCSPSCTFGRDIFLRVLD